MYHISIITVKIIITLSSFTSIRCSIAGTHIGSYKPRKAIMSENYDDCNPLYWYPTHIPEYCYNKQQRTMKLVPLPIPSIPMPPIPGSDPHLFHPVVPQPILQWPNPLPFGIPINPINLMLPVAGILSPKYHLLQAPWSYTNPYTPYSLRCHFQHRKIIFPHSYSGIMSHDGGVNILPFTDAISDLLENHKQTMISRHLRKLEDENEHFSSKDSIDYIIVGKDKSN